MGLQGCMQQVNIKELNIIMFLVMFVSNSNVFILLQLTEKL